MKDQNKSKLTRGVFWVSADFYGLIFTTAQFGPSAPADGIEILKQAINKSPILEVWIDRATGQVEQLHDVPAEDFYDGMPVPIF